MTTLTALSLRRSRLMSPGRLTGVDLARGLALLGMMSVHITPALDDDGSVSLAHQVAGGRASALFAVLAGLSLVLVTPRVGGRLLPGARRGVLARAAVIGFVGLTLGVLSSGVAVILVHYAVLFAIGALFLHLPLRALAPLAAGWLLVAPLVGHAVRRFLPAGPGDSPSWISLGDPVRLVETVLFTGYYPVLQWTGYLLVGMVIGRLPLRRKVIALVLVAVGAVLAGLAKAVGNALLAAAGGIARLEVPPSSVLFGRNLDTALQTGIYGTTPTTTWSWLAVSGPHSGTPFDLLHTTGTALLVLGGCLLLAGAVHGAWRLLLVPLAAAGSMTLTLYTVHVVALAATHGAVSGPATWPAAGFWALHALSALVLATAWQLTGQRGPLEAVAHEASAAARTNPGPTPRA